MTLHIFDLANIVKKSVKIIEHLCPQDQTKKDFHLFLKTSLCRERPIRTAYRNGLTSHLIFSFVVCVWKNCL